jgi:hypothetical protein
MAWAFTVNVLATHYPLILYRQYCTLDPSYNKNTIVQQSRKSPLYIDSGFIRYKWILPLTIYQRNGDAVLRLICGNEPMKCS